MQGLRTQRHSGRRWWQGCCQAEQLRARPALQLLLMGRALLLTVRAPERKLEGLQPTLALSWRCALRHQRQQERSRCSAATRAGVRGVVRQTLTAVTRQAVGATVWTT